MDRVSVIPIHSLNGTIVGFSMDCSDQTPHTHQLMYCSEFSIKNGLLFYVSNLMDITDPAAQLPHLTLMKQEDPVLFGLWRENVRQAVMIHKDFYQQQVQKPTFPELIKNIKKSYSDRIIIDGVQSTWEYSVLQECGVWAVQGYMHRSVPLQKLEYLL